MPTLIAATESRSGAADFFTCPCSMAQLSESASATYAPVMAAVLVPPSACNTSQSMTMVFSPSWLRSIMPRSDRPISREISWVRPPILPFTDSRSIRSFVDRGSMPYSAVTHPRPLPFNQRGTPGVKEAVQRTLVLPNEIRALPSACSLQPRSIVTGRSSLASRPSARVMGSPCGCSQYGSGNLPPGVGNHGTGQSSVLRARAVRSLLIPRVRGLVRRQFPCQEPLQGEPVRHPQSARGLLETTPAISDRSRGARGYGEALTRAPGPPEG